MIPPPLARLPELARNLWWSWHPEAMALFEALSPSSREPIHHNPLQRLLELERRTLDGCARDAEFLARYRRVLATFDADLTDRPRWSGSLDAAGAGPIAYFSAEFGVHSALTVFQAGWACRPETSPRRRATSACRWSAWGSCIRRDTSASACPPTAARKKSTSAFGSPWLLPRRPARPGSDGIPRRWLRVMKRAIQTVAPRFGARRMVKEYVEQLYAPAARMPGDQR